MRIRAPISAGLRLIMLWAAMPFLLSCRQSNTDIGANAVCGASKSGSVWAEHAMRGDLEPIMALSDQDPARDNDAQAYKWLAVAHDFGHARAWKQMRSLLEISSLRYDDGGLVTGQMHYELGLDYLQGCNGLPMDMVRASKNLALSRDGVLGTDINLESDRQRLAAEARRVFDVVFPPGESVTTEIKS